MIKDLLKKYRISEAEHQKITDLLGHPPQGIEWALFSALWSEHCSYKSSKVHLKKFAKTMTKSVTSSAGENAGIVDIGEGEAIAFKMESHNHPSFIEPYQGAATGVGGILRDIFTMGARPIALANYLCFGEPEAPRMKYLMDGVVRGIAGYGNCVGVPNVTGQTEFHSSYNKNILVNAMAVGYLGPKEKVSLSSANGEGNLVVYVGARTGKDGVHGAAMASESFEKDSEDKRPNVQIGDPFFEKLLIESCLEVIQKDLVVAIQDMGAAGLTSSSFEMASKGQVGMELYLDQVPLRDSSITPEEILLSESQERMLLVCEPSKLESIKEIFDRWDLEASVVGKITKERKVKIFWQKECLTSVDPDLLVENAPVYERPFEIPPSRLKKEGNLEIKGSFEAALKSAPLSDKKWIYRQYDQRVGGATAHGCEHDIGFVRLPTSGRALAVSVGCRPAVMRLDTRLGALDAIFYPAVQMALKGAKALAVTDCLNFGNPEKSKIMGEFAETVDCLIEASIALSSPVISGNVSFYNETEGTSITSTPGIGMIGLRPNIEDLPEDRFQTEGSKVFSLRVDLARSDIFWAELERKTPSVIGEWKPEASKSLAKILEIISTWVNTEKPKSSQSVGLAGLEIALRQMEKGTSLGLPRTKSESNRMKEASFYEMVFEVSDLKAKEKLEKELKSSPLKLEWTDLGILKRV